MNESTISMILGAIVIIVVGALVINYFRGLPKGESLPPVATDDSSEVLSIHKVGEGENLWSISITYYGTGFNWDEIAEFNGIKSPSEIEEGQEIKIPRLEDLAANITTEPTTTLTPEPTTPTETETENSEDVEVDESRLSDVDLKEVAKDVAKAAVAVEIAQEAVEGVQERRDERASEEDSESIEESSATITQSPESETSEPSEEVDESEKITGDKYVVESGDFLWDIAIKAYGDGNKWVDIAKANNLVNPNIIHRGNELVIPR